MMGKLSNSDIILRESSWIFRINPQVQKVKTSRISLRSSRRSRRFRIGQMRCFRSPSLRKKSTRLRTKAVVFEIQSTSDGPKMLSIS